MIPCNPLRFLGAGCFAVLFACFHLGTTFIIMEGEREVGRYVENDGRNEEQIIYQEAPPPPVSEKPQEVSTVSQRAFPDHEEELRLIQESFMATMPEENQRIFWDLGLKILGLWVVSTLVFIWLRKKFKE